jgi:tagatose-1,6-bisphosphate aldolase
MTHDSNIVIQLINGKDKIKLISKIMSKCESEGLIFCINLISYEVYEIIHNLELIKTAKSIRIFNNEYEIDNIIIDINEDYCTFEINL